MHSSQQRSHGLSDKIDGLRTADTETQDTNIHIQHRHLLTFHCLTMFDPNSLKTQGQQESPGHTGRVFGFLDSKLVCLWLHNFAYIQSNRAYVCGELMSVEKCSKKMQETMKEHS